MKLFFVILSMNVTFCLPPLVIGSPNLSNLFGKKYKSIFSLVFFGICVFKHNLSLLLLLILSLLGINLF